MTGYSWLDRVATELKAPVQVSADFERRVVAAVRGGAERRGGRTLAILGGVGLAASVVGAAVLGSLDLWRATTGSSVQSATTEVEFSIDVPAASAVALVGDFNDWDRARTPLLRVAGSSHWRARVALRLGTYHYAFLVDGVRWIADPSHPTPIDPDYGGVVSLVSVE